VNHGQGSFGFGATVFYNYVDFQFRNRLPFPVLGPEASSFAATLLATADEVIE